MIWICGFSPGEISFFLFIEGEDFLLKFFDLLKRDFCHALLEKRIFINPLPKKPTVS